MPFPGCRSIICCPRPDGFFASTSTVVTLRPPPSDAAAHRKRKRLPPLPVPAKDAGNTLELGDVPLATEAAGRRSSALSVGARSMERDGVVVAASMETRARFRTRRAEATRRRGEWGALLSCGNRPEIYECSQKKHRRDIRSIDEIGFHHRRCDLHRGTVTGQTDEELVASMPTAPSPVSSVKILSRQNQPFAPFSTRPTTHVAVPSHGHSSSRIHAHAPNRHRTPNRIRTRVSRAPCPNKAGSPKYRVYFPGKTCSPYRCLRRRSRVSRLGSTVSPLPDACHTRDRRNQLPVLA